MGLRAIHLASIISSSLLAAHCHLETAAAGELSSNTQLPFTSKSIAEFDMPRSVAPMPDGRAIVADKYGHMFLVSQDGRKIDIKNAPTVSTSDADGFLDVAVAPDFATSSRLYFTYTAPDNTGSGVTFANGVLSVSPTGAMLIEPRTMWHQDPPGKGGQAGGMIAFDPQGSHVFLSVGDRLTATSAQNPYEGRGKVLRFNLEGSIPSDNPEANVRGLPAMTWTTGHSDPTGLAFGLDGRLWLLEVGPNAGDELNLLKPWENYGWPFVAVGDEGSPIPRHSTRPEFVAPAFYWMQPIRPAGLVFYQGAMFPKWQGSALIGGLSARSLIRMSFGQGGQPEEADRWFMNAPVRDVAVAPDGAVWVVEDGNPGRLLRLTPAEDPCTG